jgi:hypothetical protein
MPAPRHAMSPGKPLARSPFTARTGRSLSGQSRERPEPKHAKRRDTIPARVRKLVNARDPWCQVSGSPDLLEIHHRRPKQMGGDPRPHADCPCNLIRLTRETHRWVHRNRREAEAMGLLLPAETVLPGSVSVMRGSEDGGGAAMFASCDGQWLAECPWTEAAA